MIDIYETVTNQIITALEAGVKAGDYITPWNSAGECGSPVNASTGKPYRGVNVLALWAAAHAAAYPSAVWATYKQWQELGAQVRKGERSSTIVFWKQITAAETAEDGTETEGRVRMMAKAYAVFNAAQVDGYTAAAPVAGTIADRDAAADAYFAGIGANVVHGGGRACYVPSRDLVMMPDFAAFTEAAGYYSVLAHELTHWSGAKHRLDRDLTGRFGDEAYAGEELVAELGAAFTCAGLGLNLEPRRDHAPYVASWLRVLKNDKRAIFTAAAKAQQATDYLNGLACAPALAVAA